MKSKSKIDNDFLINQKERFKSNKAILIKKNTIKNDKDYLIISQNEKVYSEDKGKKDLNSLIIDEKYLFKI